MTDVHKMFYICPMTKTDHHNPALPQARGRAAGFNPANRFDRLQTDAFDDGWDTPADPAVLRTTVTLERARSAISYNTSPDLPFDRTINPYRGCEHGCIYCFARPSHAYLGLSAGLDFETRLIARPGIADLLAEELRAPRYRCAVLAIGTNTDPYQPIERDHQVMRQILQVLAAFRHPVAITTKGTLIERDLDILGPMAAQGLAMVGISLTTLDPKLSRSLEPRAPAPARRLQMIARLAAAGVPVRAMIAPVIPALTDHELEPLLQAACDAGATAANMIPLRLPHEVAPLFQDWLTRHHPDRAARVLGRIRDLHGGQLYDSTWGQRMTGQGIWADLLQQRFTKACTRLGLRGQRHRLTCDLFAPPPRAGDQMTFGF